MTSDRYGFNQEFKDLMRGVAGGMIFGTPVLYTMEVWTEGLIFTSWNLLVVLFLILNLNICFSYFAGLRENHSTERLMNAVDDGITSLGLSLVLSFLVLALINQIDLKGNLKEELAKVLIEACIVSVGVTFTNFKFKRNQKKEKTVLDLLNSETLLMSPSEKQLKKDFNDLMAAMAGAFVFSFNVAPTEEVVLIASNLSSLHLMIILCFELYICYVILYASGIRVHITYDKKSFFQKPLAELTLTTSISLCVAAVLILTLGYGDTQLTDAGYLPSVIVLGIPAVVGGAAGRLAV